MTMKTVCPNCKSTLRVSATALEPSITCPRCLTSIANPRQAIQTERSQPNREESFTERPNTCRECAAPLEPGWRVCPVCETPVREPRRRPVSLDVEAKGDTTRVGSLLMVFSLVVAGGLIFLPVLGGRAILSGSFFSVILLVYMGLFALAAVGIGLKSSGRDAAGQAVHNVFIGLFVLGGVAVAAVLFLFVACLQALSSH